MDELKDILPSRLSEVFEGETQQVTADKLTTQQGTVSKWLSGQAIPPTDTLLYISKKYRVSIDWLLGLSDEKEIDGVVIEKLTYEQIARIIDRLLEIGSIEIPDLEQFNDGGTDDEFDDERKPNYDSDYIKVNDRALSFILRRRLAFYNVDEESLEYWMESVVKKFKGVKMLNYRGKAQEALDSQSWSAFKAGDWASMLNELGTMTESDMQKMIDKAKEGKEDGKQ